MADPLVIAGTVVALGGTAYAASNTFPFADPDPCFRFGTPTAKEEADCAVQKKRQTVGKVAAALGVAVMIAGVIRASRARHAA